MMVPVDHKLFSASLHPLSLFFGDCQRLSRITLGRNYRLQHLTIFCSHSSDNCGKLHTMVVFRVTVPIHTKRQFRVLPGRNCGDNCGVVQGTVQDRSRNVEIAGHVVNLSGRNFNGLMNGTLESSVEALRCLTVVNSIGGIDCFQ